MHQKLITWEVSNDKYNLKANTVVPNDITKLLYEQNIIEEPYFGLNHRYLKEYLDEDYVYQTSFEVKENDVPENNELFLAFNGVDLFSDIYLNGELLGSTDNMFKRYVYNVTEKIIIGKNELKVVLRSTTKYMENLDCKDYFGVFNIPRLLLRKEQCCFGWDWAPNIPGYGIWQDVELYTEHKQKLVDVHYSANMNGEAVFYVQTNYSVKDGRDNDGNLVVNPNKFDDYIRISLTKNPDGDFSNAYVKQVKVNGYKAFLTFVNKEAQLWWPIGYGEHPLYSYKVELLRDGEVISQKSGKLGYRSVSVNEKIIDDTALGCSIQVNGKDIFVKGSNWVPVDCFTGCITDEKYEQLINLAVNGNFNILRVWGGGIYEKDVFYDLCDEKGLMVWQDLAFACADLPEDNQEWVKNVCEEVEYQVKRLRNHPSLVYWCGGNEKTGSFGDLMTYGDYFTNVILRGIVTHNDETRPFVRQSPWSKTDSCNDLNSGESHYNCIEHLIFGGVEKYREAVAKKIVSFISESATQGPCSQQCFERIFPREKLWPMNEYWEDRLMLNPYSSLKLTFAERQYKLTSDFYGKPNSLKEFVAKGMLAHAEEVKCELEYERANKGKTFGFLTWMFSEIYPSATWAAVDYYTEPKQVYYQMMKSYAPVLMSFYQAKDKKTYLFGANDTLADKKVKYAYGLKTLNGEVLWKKSGETILDTNNAWALPIDEEIEKENTYLFATYDFGEGEKTSLYSYIFWKNCTFDSDYKADIVPVDEYTVVVKVHANKFVKSLFVNMKDNYKYEYSDNYIDVEAGGYAEITVRSKHKINIADMEISDYVQRTKNNG